MEIVQADGYRFVRVPEDQMSEVGRKFEEEAAEGLKEKDADGRCLVCDAPAVRYGFMHSYREGTGEDVVGACCLCAAHAGEWWVYPPIGQFGSGYRRANTN